MKRVLSVDGGGIRGLLPARILQFLEEQTGKPTWQLFDLIVGTSTGGVLACGLTASDGGASPKAQYSAGEMAGFYHVEGPGIFHRTWYQELALLKVRYGAAGIETALQKYFGARKVSEALTPIVVTAFDQEAWQPKFYKTRKALLDPKEDAPIWEAARATAAAPTYFPPFQNLVDGGILGATNPSMIALTEARMWPGEEIFLLSLGTGHKGQSIAAGKADTWGELAYLKALVDMLLDGPERTVERMVGDILDADHYIRIQSTINASGPSPRMDDASAGNLAKLDAFARSTIADKRELLDKAMKALTA